MPPAVPPRTFADLEPAGLEMTTTCQRCGHEAVIDDSSPRLRSLPLAGRRFRCRHCGGIGLPTLGKRRWAQRLAEHAKTRTAADLSGGDLPGRKIDRRR
ncbi:MAG: hypothetical protein ACOY4R_11200 [Pseudomonadota bacterium]